MCCGQSNSFISSVHSSKIVDNIGVQYVVRVGSTIVGEYSIELHALHAQAAVPNSTIDRVIADKTVVTETGTDTSSEQPQVKKTSKAKKALKNNDATSVAEVEK